MTRIPSLDGLRALSILLVVVGHIAFTAGFHSPLTDAYAHAGVVVFFVISGYLITTLMLREIERSGGLSVGQFYVRRAWRILPVAYIYLAVITLAQHAQFSWRDIGLSWGYLASCASYFGQLPWNLSHLWSLSVEEQFYFAWPLVVAFGLGKARRLAWAAVLVAPLSRYWLGHNGFGLMKAFSTPAVVDSIATGCLLAVYAPRLTKVVTGRRWLGLAWPLVFALPALDLIGNHTRWLWPLPQLFGHSAWTLFNILTAFGILWAIAAKPKVLNHWLPVWIGTLSYSLYLWQMPFMDPALKIRVWLRIPLAFACAALSYYAIERPVLALRAWIQTSRSPQDWAQSRWPVLEGRRTRSTAIPQEFPEGD
jgi:peptidoglycan/LPS O-acetylase OafA/YrhL